VSIASEYLEARRKSLEFGFLLRGAWSCFKSRPGTFIIATLLLAFIPGILQLGLGAIPGTDQVPIFISVGAQNLLTFALGQFLFLGFLSLAIKTARGKRAETGDILSQSARFVPGLIVGVLASLGLGVGLFLLVVPGIIFFVASSLAPLYVVDRDMDAIAALEASFDATRGARGRIFGVYFLTGVLGVVVTAASCGLGYLVVFPIWMLVTASVYLVQSESVAPEEPAPGALLIPAALAPRWLEAASLLFLVPPLLVGASPVTAVQLGEIIANTIGVSDYGGIAIGLSFLTGPVFAGLVILLYRRTHYRSALLDEQGAVFGRTESWRGARVAWKDVSGFEITGDGVRLRLQRRPWTRWLGPVVKSDDRLTHEVVLLLEKRGIPRIDE
jgi:hypothetical protein